MSLRRASQAQVPGVADIVPFGGYLKEIHIEADAARL